MKNVKCKICGKKQRLIYCSDVCKQLVEKGLCFDCYHWSTVTSEECILIEGESYMVGPENVKGIKGFGGRRFKIKLETGQIIETTNLWTQGTVPEYWKKFFTKGEFLSTKETFFNIDL